MIRGSCCIWLPFSTCFLLKRAYSFLLSTESSLVLFYWCFSTAYLENLRNNYPYLETLRNHSLLKFQTMEVNRHSLHGCNDGKRHYWRLQLPAFFWECLVAFVAPALPPSHRVLFFPAKSTKRRSSVTGFLSVPSISGEQGFPVFSMPSISGEHTISLTMGLGVRPCK